MRSQSKVVAVTITILVLAVIAVALISVSADPSETTKAMAVAVLALVPAAMIPFIIIKIRETADPSERSVEGKEEFLMPIEDTKEEGTIGKGPSSQ